MPSGPVVIFMTSNGVGMGHLSRQLTTIISAKDRIQPVLFSLSGALPRIITADYSGDIPELDTVSMRYEYCPSRESVKIPNSGWREKLRKRYRSYRWHPYLRDRLITLAREVNAKAVVFDGVVPYAGLLAARKLLPSLKFIWIRRGMWQSTVPVKRLALSKHFDITVEPGDFAQEFDHGPTRYQSDAHRIPPISLTNAINVDTRATARSALGLPVSDPILLIAPGSGALGSVQKTIDALRDEIRESHPAWKIAVTKQAIARHQTSADANTYVLDDVYPLARYLPAFDAAVSAAGYNAVHELLSVNVPTLLVPSRNHATDDQSVRAKGLASMGAALLSNGNFKAELALFLDPSTRSQLRNRCSELPTVSGGKDAASLILEQAEEGCPIQTYTPPQPHLPFLDARASVQKGDITGIRITERIQPGFLKENDVTEHLVQHSSDAYRNDRSQISKWIYDA